LNSANVTIEELCEVVAPIAEKHNIVKVCLFGSRARGDNDENSDFDFYITVPERFSAITLGSFLYDLRDALGSEVDVIREGNRNLSPSILEEISRDKKVLFEA